MGSKRSTLFFTDKPMFGLDVGTGSIKVMQINTDSKKKRSVVGYGFAKFDPAAMQEGEIMKFDVIAKAAQNLFKHHLIGDISTRRVALSVPTFRTYTRELQLPAMSKKELHEAVMNEAAQYIPRPLEELYVDYTVTSKTAEGTSVYVVAVSRKIIDSYHQLMRILGLEPVFIEPSIISATRLLSIDTHNEIPSVLIDFGTQSADISIFDSHVIVTGTVPSGGDLFTEHIMKTLGVSHDEATLIKTKYGIGHSKKQAQIKEAVDPLLKQTLREIKRMVRYYEERGSGKEKIEQVISMGGGANMPGLTDYLTENLRLPARMFDPWQMLDYGKLQPPGYAERSVYITVAGLALVESKGVLV